MVWRPVNYRPLRPEDGISASAAPILLQPLNFRSIPFDPVQTWPILPYLIRSGRALPAAQAQWIPNPTRRHHH